ncbi:unnamed protein product [Prorocentrum cordatum]|uniref:MSP domain-containing protein n=1 Tax=Prorocentrum cordatum TaxID=2364126 RepID=A0ABN9VEX7_9DINO|nr:unnamed protein product [Polarella glacialis]
MSWLSGRGPHPAGSVQGWVSSGGRREEEKGVLAPAWCQTFQLDARPNHSAVTLLRLDPEDRLSFRRAPDSREHSRTLRLTNRSGGHVAYKVKTTAPEAYAVQKHLGKIGPGESCDVTIVLQDPCASDPAQVRSHRFLVQAAPVGSPGAITKEAWALLDKGSIQEHCLPVVLDTAGVSAPATASAAASWARTESETELKVKYDELVQYRELLEKETQSIEAELVGLRNPRRTGVAGSGSGWSCCRRQT